MERPIVTLADTTLKCLYYGGYDIEKLKKELSMTDSEFDKTIKFLEDEGHIKCERESDNRINDIELTGSGMKIAEDNTGREIIKHSTEHAKHNIQAGIVNTGNNNAIYDNTINITQIFQNGIILLKETLERDEDVDDSSRKKAESIIDEISKTSDISRKRKMLDELKTIIPKYGPFIMSILNHLK